MDIEEMIARLKEAERRLVVLASTEMVADDALDDLRPVIAALERRFSDVKAVQ